MRYFQNLSDILLNVSQSFWCISRICFFYPLHFRVCSLFWCISRICFFYLIYCRTCLSFWCIFKICFCYRMYCRTCLSFGSISKICFYEKPEQTISLKVSSVSYFTFTSFDYPTNFISRPSRQYPKSLLHVSYPHQEKSSIYSYVTSHIIS